MKLHLLLHALWISFFFLPLSAQEPGIYADFDTSSGGFRARLDFEKAPVTTANFVGLIEGTQPYIDLSEGSVKQGQFYDGIIFHRVIEDFVIQAGSPLGTGTDGPGYQFRDEFHPDLRHDRPYVLSMANSGLHSNGSQFFITLGPKPHLDDVHSIFGQVIEGTDNVDLIGTTKTDDNDKPLTDVVINSIQITRIGAEAEAFQAPQQSLPSVQLTPSSLRFDDEKYFVAFPPEKNHFYLVFHSPDLKEWTGATIGLANESLPTEPFDITNLAGEDRQHFFRVAEIEYPGVFTPVSLQSKTLTLNISKLAGEDSTVTAIFNFDDQDKGVSKLDDEADGTILLYAYQQLPYTGKLTINSTSILPLSIDLDFSADNAGQFAGSTVPTLANPQQLPLSGTFTLTE